MKKNLAVLLGVVILVAASFAFGYYRSRPRVQSLSAPPTWFDEDGAIVTISSLRGEAPLVVFLISTNCRYCAEATDKWRQLIDEIAANRLGGGAAVLSYSPPEDTAAFLEDHAITGVPVYYLNADGVRLLNAWSVPSTILFTSDIDVRFWDGVPSDTDVNELKRYLND